MVVETNIKSKLEKQPSAKVTVVRCTVGLAANQCDAYCIVLVTFHKLAMSCCQLVGFCLITRPTLINPRLIALFKLVFWWSVLFIGS